MKVAFKKAGIFFRKKVGRKILVRAESNEKLADLLIKIADELRRGYDCINVTSSEGLRIMRPLRDGEEEYYSDARELP